jgi:hypothetical protein
MGMIYIWVRSEVDWGDGERFLAQVYPHFRPKVEAWNRTFDLPYHVFRQRVKRIAELNLDRVEDAVRAPWNEIPDGALVAPVDDDDWFAPDLGTRLERELRDGALGCYWTSSFVEVPIGLPHRLGLLRRRVFPDTPPRYTCTTNNYALVKRPDTKVYLRRHVRAGRWIEGEVTDRVDRIDARLSLMNRTLASQTSLGAKGPMISRGRLVRKLREYQRLYRDLDLPELPWCRPYLAMMGDLMDEIGVR